MKQGKVIKIVDEFTVVINKGIEDSVKQGDICLIYSLGEELFDPDTNESLGLLEIVKGQGKVIHVQDKIATVQSIEFKKTRIVRKPTINSWNQFLNQEEESFDSTMLPFKDVNLNDLVKKIR
jgi:hypothetical protein